MNLPRVSLCLFSYNQEKYIADAIKGILNQTYENLEIVISDDASTDNTFAIIQKILAEYKGPHQIILNRNKKNVGLVPHLNKLLFELATSDYFLIAAGDDICLPNRVKTTMELFKKFPKAVGASFAKTEIDAKNTITNDNSCTSKLPEVFNLYNGYYKSVSFMTPGVALGLKRQAILHFGPLNKDCPTEDSTLRYRCLLQGDFIYSYEKVMLYRWHGENLSFGANIFKLKTAFIAKQYKQDTLHALSKGYISKNDKKHLLAKIDFYQSNRKLLEKLSLSSGKIKRIRAYQLKLNRYVFLAKYYILNISKYPAVIKHKHVQKKKKAINLRRYQLGIKHQNLIKTWWVDFPNFGDQLTPALLTHFGYTPYYVPAEEAGLISVGSLFEMVPTSFKGTFLGTGFIEDGEKKKFPWATFLGVRGILSKSRHDLGDEVVLGDPGLLSQLLLPKRETKKFKLGIIIHHKEFKIPKLQKEIKSLLKKHKKEATFISVKSLDPIAVIKRIDQCEAIISSALHGLIVADALQIPNKWMVFSDRLEGGDYKFKDYYSVFGEQPAPIFLKESLLSLPELIKSTESRDIKKLQRIQEELTKAFQNLPIAKEN